MIARLAILGTLKHWKRSVVVLGAAAVSCAVMIAVGSLLNGITTSFYDSIIPGSGHVRVEDRDLPDSLNPLGLDLLMTDADARVAAIEALHDRRITHVESVLTFGGLLVEDSPEGEPRNLPMRGIALDGDTRFADTARDALQEGAFLPKGEGIALSERAARLIGASLGKGVLLLVQDRSGQPWYEKVTVTGIFRTESKDFDETTFYIGKERARQMLDLPGAAREIRLLLANRDEAAAVAADLRHALAAPGGPGRPLRIEDWKAINASVFSLLLFVNILLGIIMALFAVVAGTIIANTSLMSAMERQREFGTMRALGLRATSLRRLILTEGLVLGAAGAVLGILLGSGIVALLAQGGVDLGGAMENLGLRRYNRPRADALWYALCALTSLLVSLLATLKAAKALTAKTVAESLVSPA